MINKNYTKFSTEDLEQYALAVGHKGEFGVRYCKPRKSRSRDRRPARWGDHNLLILPPDLDPVEAVAAASTPVEAPMEWKQAVVLALMQPPVRHYEMELYSKPGSGLNEVRKGEIRRALAVARTKPLRIMQKMQDRPPKSEPLTRAQRIDRYLGFCGQGPVLRDLAGKHYLRSGRRACEYQWRINGSAHYYEREKAYRDKYAEKAAALGATVVPYETWPEYLRRMADEYEAKEK